MAKRYFSFKNGINITPVNSLPTTAKVGDVIYLITENLFKYYDGTDWQNFSSSIIKVTAGENIVKFMPLYISKGNVNGDIGRNAGKAYLLDPFNDNRMEYIGIATNNANANEQVLIQLAGKISIPNTLIQGGSFINGEMVYWDGSKYTTTVPNNTDFWLIKVGKAVSNQEMVINPDLGASAIYVPPANMQISIQNNMTTPFPTGISINPAEYSSFIISYNVKRVAGSSEKSETGFIGGVYNSAAGNWSIINYGIVGDAEIDFVMVGNAIYYTSSNMIGGPYTGILSYKALSYIDTINTNSDIIANNMTSFTNINGLFLGPTDIGAIINYYIKRQTTNPLVEKTESGILMLAKNSASNTWNISTFAVVGDAEITFNITASGQLQYTSSNMPGSGYNGNIFWKILNIF